MASITGSNNTLIGNGASVPTAGSNSTVVLGGSGSTVYMGGAQAGAAGVTVASGALTLLGSTSLKIGSDAGGTGAALLSGGTGAAPYWRSATIPITTSGISFPGAPADTYTMGANPPALYVVTSGGTNRLVFTLSNPASVPNTVITVKNSMIVYTCSLSPGSSIVDAGATIAAISDVILSPGIAATLASDGTYWYVISKQ